MPAAPIRVLHTVASLKLSSGGTSRSIPALCEALAVLGQDVTLISQATRWPVDSENIPDPALVRTELVPSVNLPKLRLSYSRGYESRLAGLCARVQIVHDHGLWLPSNHASATVARRSGLPLVVSPRGMLDAWSLEYRSFKKRIAWRLYQREDLKAVRAFCATSPQEAAGLRALGLVQPIAVIANGVILPAIDKRQRGGRNSRIALFMSRIHPKKGLLDLVQAWSVVRPCGWRLLIAGPDEAGHRCEIESAVRSAGLSPDVELIGPVEGEAKWRLLLDADLFVLPTLSENFGIVVAEALACAVPVITTRGAPWEDLVTHECGWWVNVGADAIGAAIRQAVALSDEERATMGLRGRALVERKYAWGAIAEKFRDLYAWVLGAGERPACVLK